MEVGARVRANSRRARLGTNIAITIGTCDSNTSTPTLLARADEVIE
jgi:hypothetical protein